MFEIMVGKIRMFFGWGDVFLCNGYIGNLQMLFILLQAYDGSILWLTWIKNEIWLLRII